MADTPQILNEEWLYSRADKDRDTGRTTWQIKYAPLNSIFIWCNNDTTYPRNLAKYYQRTDIEVVPYECVVHYNRFLLGIKYSGVVFDHWIDTSNKAVREFAERYNMGPSRGRVASDS